MTPPQGSETVTTETPAERCPAGPPPHPRVPGTSAASVALFAPGGVLQQWPAPAWLMDRRGRRLVANDAAGGWLESLGDSARDELASRAIEVAASGNPARLSLTIGEGEARRHLAVNLGRLDGGDVLALAHDVSFEGNLRGALVDSRARFKDLVEVSSDFAWECDGAGRFVFVSARGALGWSAADLTDRMARDLICPPPEWAAGDDTLAVIPFETHVPVGECVVWLHTAEGGAACLALSAMPLRDR
ncbi:MAG: PAS domain-containing protein, partial [Alphaproteobacteria bacterium]